MKKVEDIVRPITLLPEDKSLIITPVNAIRIQLNMLRNKMYTDIPAPVAPIAEPAPVAPIAPPMLSNIARIRKEAEKKEKAKLKPFSAYMSPSNPIPPSKYELSLTIKKQ